MKMWKCIKVNYPDKAGWTVGKIYYEDKYLIDDDGARRLSALSYNDADHNIAFTEVSFEIYLNQIENDNTINS